MAGSEYPCGWCDYLFTLFLASAVGIALHFFGTPVWAIIPIVHYITASWFLETRK